MNNQLKLGRFESISLPNVLHYRWLPNTEHATDLEMTENLMFYLDCVKQYQPQSIIVDHSELKFTFHPEFQIWIDENISAPSYEHGLKRYAFIQSEDFVTNLSVEQIYEEKHSSKFQLSYVSTIEEAKQWIVSIEQQNAYSAFQH